MLIAEQIERAAAEASTSSSSTTPPAEEGLKRDEVTEKVVLSFSSKPSAPTSASTTPSNGSGFKMNALKSAANPLKANPLKRPNVFKTAGASSSSSTAQDANENKRPLPMSAAERLIVEDQERKRRKMDREGLA